MGAPCGICGKEIIGDGNPHSQSWALPMREGKVVWSGEWAGIEVHERCYNQYWDEHRNKPKKRKES